MRASRLLSTLLLLQTRGRMTAQQLADELEVSVRTVYRDVESLAAAGIPLYGEAGHDGGYQLLDGYRTRLTGLTGDEAEALFLTGTPGAAADLGLGTMLAGAQLKLLASLPADLRDRADRIRGRFHLDTSNWYADAEATPHLAPVVDAVWNRRRLRMRYRRWTAPHEGNRTLEPYGVVLKSGRWYLVAGEKESVRTFRVSQILRVQVLDETFDRPEGFDLARFWESYLLDFDARRYLGEATLRLSPAAFERLARLFEPAVAQAAADSAQPPDADGWVKVVVPVESVEHTVGLLLPLAAEAEVLAPPELRARFAAIATALAGLYTP